MNLQHKFFFIGIGGISMSGLAIYLKKSGYLVAGSDNEQSPQTIYLENQGIQVFYKHSKTNLKDCEVVVYNSAIKEDNPELIEARKKNLIILERKDLLNKIAREHNHVIAVSGTHGKTTTTAMIGEIFYLAGLNPTIHIGGVSKNLKSNFIMGDKDYFITEACEYKNNFLSLKPELGVVLNIDEDHMEFFKTKENLTKSFELFTKNCTFSLIFDKFDKKLTNYVVVGDKGDYCKAQNIIKDKDGKFSFDCYYLKEFIGNIKLNINHEHNIFNALFAVSVAKYYGIKNKIIVSSLCNFNGVKRRFEEIGIFNGAKVIIDYAHHPKEVENVISSAVEITKGKVIVVFQPHTYSRTKKLFDEFSTCFDRCDKLFLYKTYSAREKFDNEFNAKTLCSKIKEHKICCYCDSFLKLKAKVEKIINKGDTLLILGAGDVYLFADYLLYKNENKS